MNNLNVTVVITNYNHERYLSQALASVARQTVFPFETIVIDDGSRTLPKLEGLLWANTTVVYAPHRGVGAALNTAISMMRGNILCWLPADDMWKPNKLERQTELAIQNPGCVLHSYCMVYHGDEPDHVGIVPELSDTEFAKKIRISSPYYANTFWIPKEILQTVGPFREDVPASEDYEWVLRSVVLHGVKYRLQKEALTIKRKHQDSLAVTKGHLVPSLVAQFNSEVSHRL